ncbi:MAG TPA: hypothetical protein VIK50_11835, partial [Gemmatimonadaceae bacterium]
RKLRRSGNASKAVGLPATHRHGGVPPESITDGAPRMEALPERALVAFGDPHPTPRLVRAARSNHTLPPNCPANQTPEF